MSARVTSRRVAVLREAEIAIDGAPTWAKELRGEAIDDWQSIDRARARRARCRRDALAARSGSPADLASARRGVLARLPRARDGLPASDRAGPTARGAGARLAARADRGTCGRRALVLRRPRVDPRRDAGDRVGVARRGGRQERARDRGAGRRPSP